MQREILDKDIDLWVIDADRVAREAEMGNRINTVMQPCFFQLSGVLPPDDAIEKIKAAVESTYAKRGRAVIERNFAAIDTRARQPPPRRGARGSDERPVDRGDGPRRRAGLRQARHDDADRAATATCSPSSALPVDGTFPTGTTKYEKRSIAKEIPIWDPDVCIDCGKCAIVCPHATIRMKVFGGDVAAAAPEGFLTKPFRSKDLAGHHLTIQVAPDDCTGCGVCVDVCPAKSKTEIGHKAINMEPLPGPPRRRARALGALPGRSRTSIATCCRTTR